MRPRPHVPVTYVGYEVRDVSGTGGQHARRRWAHSAEWSVSAQRRPTWGDAQGRQLRGVAQLADVVGILRATVGTQRRPSTLGAAHGWGERPGGTSLPPQPRPPLLTWSSSPPPCSS